MRKKITIDNAVQSEAILVQAAGRANFPVNYAISRNTERLTRALKPAREELSREPICFSLPAPDTTEEQKAEITDEQKKEGKKAFEAWQQSEIEIDVYQVDIDKLPNELKAFSPARERLSPEGLQALNENFGIMLELIGVVKEGE